MSDKHPLSASASGTNAYYLGLCRHTEHNPAYAACLDKIRRLKAGDTKNIWPKCIEAIGLHTCQAQNMRQAEELAGHAMYFVPRETRGPAWSTEPTDSNRVEKAPAKEDRFHTEHVPAAPRKHAPVEHGTYADAINAAMQAQPAPVPAPAAPVAAPAKPVPDAPKREPGESIIQYAARLRAARNEGSK